MNHFSFIGIAIVLLCFLHRCNCSTPNQLLKLKIFNKKKAKEIFEDSFQYRIISTNGNFTEGPVWIPESHGKCSNNEIPGTLLFSDVPANRIFKWHNNKVSTFLNNSGCDLSIDAACRNYFIVGSNGLAIDPLTNKLTLVRHGAREVAQYDPCKQNKLVQLIGRYNSKRLNSPNDLIFTKSGDFYFTDPPYGILTEDDFASENFFNMTEREIDFTGVYFVNRKTSKLTVIDKTVKLPNGIGLSADQKNLYVSSSEINNAYIKKYQLADDGSVLSSSIFYNFTAVWDSRNALSDGLKLDMEGNLYAANSGAGLHILSPNAELIANIETHKGVSNVAFGGGYLFLTMESDVAAVPINKNWASMHYQAKISCDS